MKPIPFKIDGEQHYIPTQWEHITTKQYSDLRGADLKDDILILSILLGVDYKTIYNTRQNDIDTKVAPFLKFLNRPFTGNNMPPVYSININGKLYDVPKDLTVLSFGQKISARNKMNSAVEKSDDIFACISEVVAIYMQPIVQGREYNEDDAMKFSKEVIDKCSIIETYAIASFFLSRLTQYKSRKTLPYPINLIRNKYLRAYFDWVYFRKSQQSTLLQGVTS